MNQRFPLFLFLLTVCALLRSYDDEMSIAFWNLQAEAIRKILGQDSNRKKREDKIKKRQEELAQVNCLSKLHVLFILLPWPCRHDTVAGFGRPTPDTLTRVHGHFFWGWVGWDFDFSK